MLKKSLFAGLIALGTLFNVVESYATDLNLDGTFLPLIDGQVSPRVRGPPGTKLDLRLEKDGQILWRNGIFDENGIMQIKDIFNTDSSGIEETVNIPYNNFIDVAGTNLIFSPDNSKHKGSNDVLGVAVYNYKGEKVSDIPFSKHEGYITAHWDGKGVSNSKYFFGVETAQGNFFKGFLFNKDNPSKEIPSYVFDKMNSHKSNKGLEDVVRNESKGMWDLQFTYTCNEEGPADYQHEVSVFNESVDDGLAWFTPEHYLTRLEQKKDANFQVVNGYDGVGISDSSVRFLNGEKEEISRISTDGDGRFSVYNLPTDTTFYVQVSHPSLRNMEYGFTVMPRTTFADTISVNPYYGITTVPDGTHYIALFKEPGDYVAKMDGVDVNNPDLTITRIMEGQVESGLIDHDGRVLRDFVMNDPDVSGDNLLKCYNLTSLQETYLDNFVKKILGGEGFSDYFVKHGTLRSPPSIGYNYIVGDVDDGINWEDTGNTTEAWEEDIYNLYGDRNAYMVTGGNTESGGEISTYHEIMNYMYPESVLSEDSPANPSSGNVSINDPLAVQYKMDVDRAKYNYGWFTGETGDLRREIPDFKSFNPYNIIDLEK